MGFKLTGLSEVTRNMEQLKQALDGAVARVSFDPSAGWKAGRNPHPSSRV